METQTKELPEVINLALGEIHNKYVKDAKIAALSYYTILVGRQESTDFPVDFITSQMKNHTMTTHGRESYLSFEKSIDSTFKKPKKYLMEIFVNGFKIILKHDLISRRDYSASELADNEVKLIRRYAKGDETTTPRLFKGSEVIIKYIEAVVISHYRAHQLSNEAKIQLQRLQNGYKKDTRRFIETYQKLHFKLRYIKEKYKDIEDPNAIEMIAKLEAMTVAGMNKIVAQRDIDFVKQAITETHKDRNT